MKLIYLIRVISIALMVGTVGAVEYDQITLWTGFCQSMLGITLMLLSNFLVREKKKHAEAVGKQAC